MNPLLCIEFANCPGDRYNKQAGNSSLLVCRIVLFLQQYSVNADAAVLRIAIDAFHAVVADFSGIKIAAVTFTASDTFTVIKNTLTMKCHRTGTPPFVQIIHRF